VKLPSAAASRPENVRYSQNERAACKGGSFIEDAALNRQGV
jgi:hypothetical protein